MPFTPVSGPLSPGLATCRGECLSNLVFPQEEIHFFRSEIEFAGGIPALFGPGIIPNKHNGRLGAVDRELYIEPSLDLGSPKVLLKSDVLLLGQMGSFWTILRSDVLLLDHFGTP